MKITDDMLAAYADRELDPDQVREVYAAAANDRALADRLLAQETLGPRVSRAYDHVLDEPIPPALLAAVGSAKPAVRPFGRVSAFAAMAACLVIGALAGRATLQAPLTTPDMMAQGRLASVLEEGLASAPERAVRLGVTFKQQDGRYCRSFETPASQGLACQEAQGWRVAVLAPGDRQDTAFRTASSMTPALAAAIQARMAGPPLDAAAEKAARDSGLAP